MKMLVDDVRNIKGMDIIVRNYNSAITVLTYFLPRELYIDHDLGEEKTGYHLICTILNDAIGRVFDYKELEDSEEFYLPEVKKEAKNYVPEKIVIVSANPIGRQNIERALDNFGYFRVVNEEGVSWVIK